MPHVLIDVSFDSLNTPVTRGRGFAGGDIEV